MSLTRSQALLMVFARLRLAARTGPLGFARLRLAARNLRLLLLVYALTASGAHAADPEDAAARPWHERAAELARPESWEPWLARLGPAAFWNAGVRDLGRGALTRDALWTAASAGLLLVLLGMLARQARRRGMVAVCLEYPTGLRGTFCVRLAAHSTGTHRAGRFGSPADAARARGNASSNQRVRYDVSRETLFLNLPCQRHFVSVDGYVQTAESEDVAASHFAEQEVRPRPGETLRVQFDFVPRACPVEVRVAWDRRSAPEAVVARTARRARCAMCAAWCRLARPRRHTLVAGSDDRVAEVSLEVERSSPRVVVIDLGLREQLVFTGCPPAVEPYLNGDVPAAARALEREGQHAVAHRLLARFHHEQGRAAAAARHYEQAEEPAAAAAELYRSLGEFEKAAQLYESLGEDERAGEMYRSAGKLSHAGEAYIRADAYDSAVECFRSAGDVRRLIEAL